MKTIGDRFVKHSLSYLTTKMVRSGLHYYLNADFQPIFVCSVSALTPSEKRFNQHESVLIRGF